MGWVGGPWGEIMNGLIAIGHTYVPLIYMLTSDLTPKFNCKAHFEQIPMGNALYKFITIKFVILQG